MAGAGYFLSWTSGEYSASNGFPLSFQEAVRPVHSTSYYTQLTYLFSDGCQNCTASCLDNAQAFVNVSTFHDCMAYPMASDLYQTQNFSAQNDDRRHLDSLHVVASPRGSDLHGQIIGVMQKCLEHYGDNFHVNDPDASLLINSTSAFYPYYTEIDGSLGGNKGTYNETFSSHDSYALIDDLCNSQQVGLNPDIGGIGVRHARLVCIRKALTLGEIRFISHTGFNAVSLYLDA